MRYSIDTNKRDQLITMLDTQAQFNQWQKSDSIQRVSRMSTEKKLVQYASLMAFVREMQSPAVQAKKFEQKVSQWQEMNAIRQIIAKKTDHANLINCLE